jgi:hypothetical protein
MRCHYVAQAGLALSLLLPQQQVAGIVAVNHHTWLLILQLLNGLEPIAEINTLKPSYWMVDVVRIQSSIAAQYGFVPKSLYFLPFPFTLLSTPSNFPNTSPFRLFSFIQLIAVIGTSAEQNSSQ